MLNVQRRCYETPFLYFGYELFASIVMAIKSHSVRRYLV